MSASATQSNKPAGASEFFDLPARLLGDLAKDLTNTAGEVAKSIFDTTIGIFSSFVGMFWGGNSSNSSGGSKPVQTPA